LGVQAFEFALGGQAYVSPLGGQAYASAVAEDASFGFETGDVSAAVAVAAAAAVVAVGLQEELKVSGVRFSGREKKGQLRTGRQKKKLSSFRLCKANHNHDQSSLAKRHSCFQAHCWKQSNAAHDQVAYWNAAEGVTGSAEGVTGSAEVWSTGSARAWDVAAAHP
jgi:hypothetical protein